MKIRANRTLRGDAGNIRRGTEAEVSEAVGKQLIKRGFAVAIEDAEPAPSDPTPKPHVKARPKAKSKNQAKDAPASSEGE